MMQVEELLRDTSVIYRVDASDYKGIAILFSSCANSKGGTILFGVSANGKVKGVNPERIVEDIKYALDNYCSFSIKWDQEQLINGRHLLIMVQISKGNKLVPIENNELKEYYYNTKGDPVIANKIILKTWSIEKGRSELKPLETFENDIVEFIKDKGSVSLSLLYKNVTGKNSSIEIALSQLIHHNRVEIIKENDELRYSLLNTID